MSAFEIIVVGSGLSGIAFARFYLDMHPQCQLAILEEDSCVGGVWSASRTYDEFYTQTGRRMAGFSDVPFTTPPEAPLYHDTFQAKFVTKYLEEYVDSHVYCGRSLRSRIFFKYRVQNIHKIDGNWHIESAGPDGVKKNMTASKLVIASGITSNPNMPVLPSMKAFAGPIVHHKYFGTASKTLITDSDCNNVVVLGGGKSATDMVYESIKKGKLVNWVIRKNGEGPALFFPASGKGQFKNSVERASTRISATLKPSSFMPRYWLLGLIYRTKLGVDYLKKKILAGDQGCRAVAAYRTRGGALPSFRLLECTTSAFWCTGPLGLVQHADFWDTLAQNAIVHRNEISSLKSNAIVLDDGSEIPADILLCGTGWKLDYPFLSLELANTLGLPGSFGEDTAEEAKTWANLLDDADHHVLAEFPQLANPPIHREPRKYTSTSRLYNCIAPLHDNSVAFLGAPHVSNSFRTAEAQAIWTTAYFDGSIQLPPLEQAQRTVAYTSAFSRRRYPSNGAAGNFLFTELVWYTDKLLRDVGMRSHLKGWWAYWMDPCLAADYKGIKEEYRQKYGL